MNRIEIMRGTPATPQLLLHIQLYTTGQSATSTTSASNGSRRLRLFSSGPSCPKCKLRNSLAALQQLRRRPPSLLALLAGGRKGYAVADSTRRPAMRRYAAASTLASVTAVNGPNNIPLPFQPLHKALARVSDDATNYVNISRLRLALLGLQSTSPLIRLAIFGFQGQQSARQLARLLVADPSTEEALWEKHLYSLDVQDDRSIILRYGDGSESASRDSLNSTYHVPSEFLRTNNLEILISSMNVPISGPTAATDVENFQAAALVPTAEIPKPFGGAVAFIRYPVHRAIIVANDIPGCFSLGKYSSTTYAHSKVSSGPLMYTVNLSQSTESGNPDSRLDDLIAIDLTKAGQAFSKFRRMAWNEKSFKEAWNQTGVPKITSWLHGTHESGSVAIQPAMKELVTDLLNEAFQKIELEAATLPKTSTSNPGLDQAREGLDEALKIWAAQAHTELRDELDAAFIGKSWAKIKWWKLPWRVDDISMIVSELLERRWLPEAEKFLIWLSGRCTEAGFVINSTAVDDKPALDVSEGVRDTSSLSSPSLSAVHDINELPFTGTIEHRRTYPWSTMLHNARYSLQSSMVPPLQALAQALLLQTFTITTMSSALSVLAYLALPTATLYNSAAIAALGLVWSLRRAQRKWEDERKRFEDDVRTRGRAVLKETEQEMRATILGGAAGSATDLVESVQSNQTAMEAVKLAQAELGRIDTA